MKSLYEIAYPSTPGAQPMIRHRGLTLAAARKVAKAIGAGRSDLRGQDIRIERVDGTLIEYAGPCR